MKYFHGRIIKSTICFTYFILQENKKMALLSSDHIGDFYALLVSQSSFENNWKWDSIVEMMTTHDHCMNASNVHVPVFAVEDCMTNA